MEEVVDGINELAKAAKVDYASKGRGQPVKDRMAHRAYLDGLAAAKAVVEEVMKPAVEETVDEVDGDGVQTETEA